MTDGTFFGEDVTGEEFTLAIAIHFNDPVVETDGEHFTTYIDQTPMAYSVILSAEIGGLEEEVVLDNTVGPQDDQRTRLTIGNDVEGDPFFAGDNLFANILGESGVHSFFHESYITLYHQAGDFTDGVSLEQDITYEVQEGDYAPVYYRLFDNLILQQRHSFSGTAETISLNDVDPRDFFEAENLALLGFPAEAESPALV